MLFLHGLHPYYANSLLGGEWYLGALVIFYLLAPLLYKVIDNMEKSFAFLIVSAFISFESVSIMGRFHPCIDEYTWNEYCHLCCFAAHFSEIAAGIFLYYLYKKEVFQKIWNKRLVSVSMLLGSVLLFYGQLAGVNSAYRMIDYMWYVIIYGFVLSSQLIFSSRLLDNKLWRSLGKKSYPMYLFHMIILSLCEWLVSYLGIGNPVLNWVMVFVMTVTGSYISGIVLVRFYDRPIQKRLKALMESSDLGMRS